MIVVDAGVLIALWDRSNVHFSAARDIFGAHPRSSMHPVSLGEALVHTIRNDDELWARERLPSLGVREVAVAADQGFALARARVETGLKMPDCCVLVCAEQLGVPLATFDRRLAEVARARGIVVLP